MAILGRYRVGYRPQFAVTAIDLLGQALAVRGPFAPPTCPLQFVLVAQTAPTARSFTPPLTLETRQSPDGALVVDGTYRIGDGPLQAGPIADGTYAAELRGEFYRAQPFAFTWPPAALHTPINAGVPQDIGLMPGPAYPYPELRGLPFNLGPTLVRGAVFSAAGDPVVDARVQVLGLPALNPPNPPWPFLETRTGSTGDWTLFLPDRRRIGYPAETTAPPPVAMTVRVSYPNAGPVVDIVNVPITFGGENPVPNTALRGTVTRSGGRALAGIRIQSSINALESRTRDDGRWSLYFDPNQPDVNNASVTATAPDGSTTTLNGVAVRQRGTVVVPTIHLP